MTLFGSKVFASTPDGTVQLYDISVEIGVDQEVLRLVDVVEHVRVRVSHQPNTAIGLSLSSTTCTV